MDRAPTDDAIIATLADALPVGVWVARAPGGEFVYANQIFMEIMGMGARDDVARGAYAEPYQIHDRKGELYPEERMPFVRALAERSTVMVDDLVIHRRDEGRVAVRAYARPIFEGETITHVVIAFFDITREVEAEARMQRAQRMESIGNLAGGIAHDFNNLLTAIKGITSLLILDERDPSRRESLQSVVSAADSATQLTQALLGFAGKGKNLAVPVALDAIVGRVSELCERAFDRRFELHRVLEPVGVVGDGGQLEQVVMNLLLNARDATPDGGSIQVRTHERDGMAVLEVEDQGPGVPFALRERIFEPYFTTKDRGAQASAGLGLATAYGIVEAHGGTIDVGDGSHGALFRVRLPAPIPRPVQPLRGPGPVVHGTGTILVIEDEQMVRFVAQRILETAGYEVLSAIDGAQGLEVFRAHQAQIDGVLLDLSMPNLDGHDTFHALRRLDPGVRVLVMTGHALNELAQDLLDQGVRGFLSKPFAPQALTDEIARILAG
ncbi:MAG TPA: PAS domain-containing hybrid sensor histidine kinase/response regulator [Deltaproteobacteria bacterium]|nr:PAS domain-containing hybrid sensor histidine kinase/response regulator [Deltaproteobacteria bacterium]